MLLSRIIIVLRVPACDDVAAMEEARVNNFAQGIYSPQR